VTGLNLSSGVHRLPRCSELAAGGGDLAAARQAYGRRDAGPVEGVLERGDRVA